MSEEQKEKWYNSFTREQLIERCEYLQRSCERKEETIADREMENADLDTKIEKLNEENYELYLQCKQYEDKEEDLENKIERRETIIKEIREYIEKNTQWYDEELGLVEMEGYDSNRIPVVYLYGLLEIIDKEKE